MQIEESDMKGFSRLLVAVGLVALLGLEQAVAATPRGTVLITGANRGIGLALAGKFLAEGYQVIGTARKPAVAKDLQEAGIRVQQLDVTSQASVNDLAQALAGQPIDILINNAGIIGHSTKTFAELDVDQLDRVFDVNTLGPLRVTQALMPNLEAGQGKTVATISSTMGSIERNTWRCCIGYRASKAAVNSANKTLSIEYGGQGFVFVVLHPGYVKTDMNNGAGEITSQQSADGLFAVISNLQSEDNGGFYDWQGKMLPW
jgi:NAD(P)-dependent dehydrogenase (short-subunit alcohol dehydrogenase family)